MGRSFTELFAEAMGHSKEPYPYQVRLAEDGLPDVVHAATGTGKTAAVVLAWLYRITSEDRTIAAETPRRLIMVLPTRALTTQVGDDVARWLKNLGLSETVRVHTMMGGALDKEALHDWRRSMHRPTVVIGTMDMILSRALVRGYGCPRGVYPIDAALVTNGAHIVVDEVQLSPQGVSSLRQLAAFQRRYKTAEPVGLTLMSATIDERIMSTIDNPFDEETARIVTHEDAASGYQSPSATAELGRRSDAQRTIRHLGTATAADLGCAIIERHKSATLTLAVVNTVETAREVYRQVREVTPRVPVLLLHSRFRGEERRTLEERRQQLAASGGIIISTQCIEAGVDMDAATLYTELAPWPSLMQRIGRCNRSGTSSAEQSTIYWTDTLAKGPYDTRELEHARAALADLDGQIVTASRLAEIARDRIPNTDLDLRILRRRDFDQLFDTTPDLSGADIDIRRFIHSDDDLDVQLAWTDTAPTAMRMSRPVYPPESARCPVSFSAARSFLRKPTVEAWTFRPEDDAWVRARQSTTIRPQEVVLVAVASGGYSTEFGFDPGSRSEVPAVQEPEARPPEDEGPNSEPGSVNYEASWLSLAQHGEDVLSHVRALLDTIEPNEIDVRVRRAAAAAGLLHDIGKSHPDWQRAVVATSPQSLTDDLRPVAKSPSRTPLRFKDKDGKRRFGFRHEMVSVALLETPGAREVLDAMGVDPEDRFLVSYLVGAHHGYLRVSGRDPRADGRTGQTLFGCVEGEDIGQVQVRGHRLGPDRISLAPFKPGAQRSWTEQVEDLLGRLGPFRLAYLEALVRMADWRASAGLRPAERH